MLAEKTPVSFNEKPPNDPEARGSRLEEEVSQPDTFPALSKIEDDAGNPEVTAPLQLLQRNSAESSSNAEQSVAAPSSPAATRAPMDTSRMIAGQARQRRRHRKGSGPRYGSMNSSERARHHPTPVNTTKTGYYQESQSSLGNDKPANWHHFPDGTDWNEYFYSFFCFRGNCLGRSKTPKVSDATEAPDEYGIGMPSFARNETASGGYSYNNDSLVRDNEGNTADAFPRSYG
eukprot:Filipodium_phascolosomae@DN4894_c0_g1_i1.p1